MSSSKPATLRVELELGAPGPGSPARVRDAVAQEFALLCARLGVPVAGEPDVAVTAGDDLPADRPLRLRVPLRQ